MQAIWLIPTIIIALVVAGIVGAVGAGIIGDTRDSYVTNTAGCNATATNACGSDYNSSRDAGNGIMNVTEKFPLVGTIAILAVIILLIVGTLMFKKMG